MNSKTSFVLRVLALGAVGIGTSQAALIDRGGGLIYDDVLNVTWLQDTEYSLTSGQAGAGMTWDSAVNWISGLEYYDEVRGVSYDDWRLPTTVDADTSYGWDPTGASSELAYMYYVNLGFEAAPMVYGIPNPESDNYNPFLNLRFRTYWSEQSLFDGRDERSWYFHMHFGFQDRSGWGDDGVHAWAVRDGDVASVPEPGTLALFGVALLGLGLVRRRRLTE